MSRKNDAKRKHSDTSVFDKNNTTNKTNSKVIQYCPEFRKPTLEDIENSRGAYPWSEKASLLDKRARLAGLARQISCESVYQQNLNDLDNPNLYTNVRSDNNFWWSELPPPINRNAWLVTYVEDGQTFPQYTDKYLSDYRFEQGDTIYILPILSIDGVASIPNAQWSQHAPSLSGLAAWVAAFYGRRCTVLSPAFLYPTNDRDEETSKPTKSSNKNSQAASFIFHHPLYKMNRKVKGRSSSTVEEDELFSGFSSTSNNTVCPQMRCQVRVQDLLTHLESLKSSIDHVNADHKAISVVGVSMVDVLSHTSDLFVAGFAGRGVSMLSLRRYHPRMVMSDTYWDDYAFYADRHPSNVTYMKEGREDDSDDGGEELQNRKKKKQKPSTPLPELLCFPPVLTMEEKSEFFRRAGRLLTHELGHNYGLEHCIHHHCYMNGSGNLEEDFATPAIECGLCLRKLQFRLGFGVIERYHALLQVYRDNGMDPEAKWTSERIAELSSLSDDLPSRVGTHIVNQGSEIETMTGERNTPKEKGRKKKIIIIDDGDDIDDVGEIKDEKVSEGVLDLQGGTRKQAMTVIDLV